MRSFFVCIVLLAFACVAASSSLAQQVFNPIAESHIEANVPEGADFDAFMKRDLESYFKSVTGRAVEVKYELLRTGPTQTGVAYPKFYLWVDVLDGRNSLHEGAVRVAAIDKSEFSITVFLEREKIEQNPEILYTSFPKPVADIIKEKMAKYRLSK